MRDHEFGGKACQRAIGRPALHRHRRHDADGIARGKTRHPLAQPLDEARRLQAEAGRQARRLDVAARAHQRLGPVEAERLDADLHLAGAWAGQVDILDAQHIRAAMAVETNDTGHAGHSKSDELNDLCAVPRLR